MIIENNHYTRAAMALGGAITELHKAKQELNRTLRNFDDEKKLLDSLAFQARLVLTVVESHYVVGIDKPEKPIDPSLAAGSDVPADPDVKL